ncbi:MAG TPA: hypothetical protein VGI45_03770 [Terracidiphilus sp.]
MLRPVRVLLLAGASGNSDWGCRRHRKGTAGLINAAFQDIAQLPGMLIVQTEVGGFLHHLEGVAQIGN